MALGRFQFQVKSLIGFNFAFGMYFSEEKSLCSHLQINVVILLVRVVEQSTINQGGKNYRSKALKKLYPSQDSKSGLPTPLIILKCPIPSLS